jgi:hypothetical protein
VSRRFNVNADMDEEMLRSSIQNLEANVMRCESARTSTMRLSVHDSDPPRVLALSRGAAAAALCSIRSSSD